jgi:catechol 2,3-dioxygenase-like lactoylglutathione lyase family enzyme
MPGPLRNAHTVTKLPAQDLERARGFYRDKLGLEPVEERTGGLRYVCGPTEFHLFSSAGTPSGASTQMAFEVEDLEATLAALRARGVTFERFECPASRSAATRSPPPITTRARARASSARSSTTAKATSSGSPNRSARPRRGRRRISPELRRGVDADTSFRAATRPRPTERATRIARKAGRSGACSASASGSECRR